MLLIGARPHRVRAWLVPTSGGALSSCRISDAAIRRIARSGTYVLCPEAQRTGALLFLQIAPEATADDLINCRDIVLSRIAAGRRRQAANGKPAVFGLPRQAVLEHHHGRDDLAALQIRDVKTLDTQRGLGQAQRLLDLLQSAATGGQVARPPGLVERQRFGRVACDGLQQRPLVAATGDPQLDAAPTAGAEPVRQRGGINRERWDEHLFGHRVAGLAAVELLKEMLDQPAGGHVLDLVDDKAALAADSSPANMEHLECSLELILGQRDHVRVGTVTEDDRILLQRALEGLEIVAQPRRLLELQVRRCDLHLLLEPSHVGRGLPGHEVAELLDNASVFVSGDPAHAGCGALADIAEQTWPADLVCPLEHTVGAGPCRKHAQQEIKGFPDRPRMRIWAEVTHPLTFGTAHYLQPRIFLIQRDGKARIALVVAIADVEPGVELLDPGVLELQCLDFSPDDRPLNRTRGQDHGLRPRVQAGDVLEV